MGSSASQVKPDKSGNKDHDEERKARKSKMEKAIKTIKSHKRFFDDNGELSNEKWEAIRYLLEVAGFLQNANSPNPVKHTSGIADLLIKENIVEVMCELVYIVYGDGMSDLKPTAELFKVSEATLGSIHAFTSISQKFCEAVCQIAYFMETMTKILNTGVEQNPIDESVEKVLLILRNIALRESFVTYIRPIQYQCVKAIWALTSVAGNRKTMAIDEQTGVIDLLLTLKTSRHDIKSTCSFILWTLRVELETSTKYSSLVESYMNIGEDKPKQPDTGHIMISYEWSNQKELKTIRDRLKAAGHKVWMDIDNMGGSTVKCMANAVENAKIVLICMSKLYEDSPACQAEAEYAYLKKKRIIPLKLQRNYEQSGGVGLIVGMKLYHEFTDKYPFEVKMAGLLRDIANNTEVEQHQPRPTTNEILDPVKETDTRTSTVSTPPVSFRGNMTKPVTHMSSHINIKTIRAWTEADVQTWIENNNLQSCDIADRTGEEIALFVQMSNDSPVYFYRCLKKMWQLHDALIYAKIVWAFNDLAKDVQGNAL